MSTPRSGLLRPITDAAIHKSLSFAFQAKHNPLLERNGAQPELLAFAILILTLIEPAM